jgi:hypothetical protein
MDEGMSGRIWRVTEVSKLKDSIKYVDEIGEGRENRMHWAG